MPSLSAYGPALGLPDTKLGAFTPALYEQTKTNGWAVVSMKDDWKTVFAFEKLLSPKMKIAGKLLPKKYGSSEGKVTCRDSAELRRSARIPGVEG